MGLLPIEADPSSIGRRYRQANAALIPAYFYGAILSVVAHSFG